MKIYTSNFEWVRAGENSDEISDKNIEFWESSCTEIAKKKYKYNNTGYEINADWSVVANFLKKQKKSLESVVNPIEWLHDYMEPLRFSITLICNEDDLFENNICKFLINYYLNEFFLITNFYLPGVCDFYNLKCLDENGVVLARNQKASLSSFDFFAWRDNEKMLPSFQSKAMNINDVYDWFNAVFPDLQQKAKNKTQQSIYAILHISNFDGEIEKIIWLFNALESLFETKNGSNQLDLLKRIVLFLEVPKENIDYVKKKIKDIYVIRSSFVHGGYSTAHPLHDERVDKELEDDFHKRLNTFAFGFAILAASIQKMIRLKIYRLNFEEVLVMR